ncbi:MAG TPA: phosphodiester glycosidase family protein [Candidatus Methylacidiphilales bacterium]|nr:phosphodiester glycosidase family protein [Candidatus Methylacidiphilales bacterium]
MRLWLRLFGIVLVSVFVLFFLVIDLFWGPYGVHTVIRNGIAFWLPVSMESSRLSPSMRLALAKAPTASPGAFTWQKADAGFEVADLPALVNGQAVDHVYLARIDPAHFRFVLRNGSNGDKDLDTWMAELGASLVVNGSYFSRFGGPDTPFLIDGVLLGPKDYDAKAGAFVTSASFTGIRDLAHKDWRTVFRGADNAMVSYPLLVRNGASGVSHPSRWLANRSFVGQDRAGRVIIGTTTDAFFSLERLAQFLIEAPLDLKMALNLDGGPVACQGISLNGYQRRTYGRFELEVQGDQAQLLTRCYGTAGMPVVLAVFPK